MAVLAGGVVVASMVTVRKWGDRAPTRFGGGAGLCGALEAKMGPVGNDGRGTKFAVSLTEKWAPCNPRPGRINLM